MMSVEIGPEMTTYSQLATKYVSAIALAKTAHDSLSTVM